MTWKATFWTKNVYCRGRRGFQILTVFLFSFPKSRDKTVIYSQFKRSRDLELMILALEPLTWFIATQNTGKAPASAVGNKKLPQWSNSVRWWLKTLVKFFCCPIFFFSFIFVLHVLLASPGKSVRPGLPLSLRWFLLVTPFIFCFLSVCSSNYSSSCPKICQKTKGKWKRNLTMVLFF